MPRRQRLDFKDAIQYVHLQGSDGKFIFFNPAALPGHGESPRQHPGVRRFETLLTSTCEDCAANLLAYCIEPNSAWLVLQITGAPLAACIRRLSGQYSRRSGRLKGPPMFARRYESRVVAPEYLPHAVRRVHCRPVGAGLCRHRVDYPFSSERTYLGEPATLPVDVGPVRNELRQKGLAGQRGYREFMDREETLYVAKLFTQGSPEDPRVVGSKSFAQMVQYLAAHPPPPPTREELIDGVARILGRAAADLYMATRIGVLGRSLVAWYGLRLGAASLTEMAHWFSITPATLGQAMHHHRQKTPELFSNGTLSPTNDPSMTDD